MSETSESTFRKQKKLNPIEAIKLNNEYYNKMLKDPAKGHIPFNIRQLELEFLEKLQTKLKKENEDISYTWKEIGPNNVGGRTRAIGIDVLNRYVIVGGVSGGIWKSTDQGESWQIKTKSNNTLNITAIAQDTREGYQNIWYCGTGEFNLGLASNYLSSAITYGTGIYKSTDHGETWAQIKSPEIVLKLFKTSFAFISEIVLDPSDGNLFIATNEGEIFRSEDGGKGFTSILGNNGGHFFTSIDISGNGVLLAALSEFGYDKYFTGKDSKFEPGIYKSLDKGDTWQNITPLSFPKRFQKSVVRISKSNPDIAYSLTTNGKIPDETVWFYKIKISENSFENRSENIPDYSANSINGKFNSWGSYCFMLSIKPDDENFVIIGGVNLYRSNDGFKTYPTDYNYCWIGGYSKNSYAFYANHHPDQHSLIFNPTNYNEVWSGHDGGVSISSNINTRNNLWESKNNRLNITQFYRMSLHPNSSNGSIIGGTQDNGTPSFEYKNNTVSAAEMIFSGDGYYCYLGTDYLLASFQNGTVAKIEYKRNGLPGNALKNTAKWSLIYPKRADRTSFFSPFAVDPNEENELYYAAGNQLWANKTVSSLPWYSNDGVNTGWENLIELDAPNGYSFSAMQFSNKNERSILYCGCSSQNGNPIIYKINTNSTTPQKLLSYKFTDLPNGSFIHDISVNQQNSNELMVLFSNYEITGTWYSNDGGKNFVSVEGNLDGKGGPSIRSAEIIQIGTKKKYILGTSIGLFSTDTLTGALTEWRQEGSETIGNVVIPHVTSRVSDNRIGVATHGRGIFLGELNTTTSIKLTDYIPNNYELYQNYPNPFNPTTTIEFSIPDVSTQNIKLIVFDILGKKIKTLVDKNKRPGVHRVKFNAADLSSGIYFYTISAGNYTQTKKMVLMQ